MCRKNIYVEKVRAVGFPHCLFPWKIMDLPSNQKRCLEHGHRGAVRTWALRHVVFSRPWMHCCPVRRTWHTQPVLCSGHSLWELRLTWRWSHGFRFTRDTFLIPNLHSLNLSPTSTWRHRDHFHCLESQKGSSLFGRASQVGWGQSLDIQSPGCICHIEIMLQMMMHMP